MSAINFIDSKKWKYIFSAVALIFFVVVFFRELLSPDVIINATDILTQDYFWHVFYHEKLHTSPSFLTWLPYINSGASFNGGLHQIFIPITLISTYLFPPNLAITASGLIHLFLAGLFTLMYARLIGLGFKASFLAATFFMLSTEIVSLINAGHIGKLNTVAMFPLVLFALERALQKRRFIDFVFAGVALSLQFYENHIQICFYSCIVVGIYFIWRSVNIFREEKDTKLIGRLYIYGTVMVLLFLSLSATSLNQWLEFKSQSERSEGTPYEFATTWSMPPQELATYIVPQLFGLSRENYKDPGKIKVFYWGEMPFTQTADYLGLLPLILAVIALIKCRGRGRHVLLFLFIAVLFQILAMGKYTPIYYFFYKYLGFGFFRVPKMNLFVVAFAVSIMAGYGAQWILEEMDQKERPFLKRVVFWVLGSGVVIGLLALFANFNQSSLIQYFMSDLRGSGRAYNPSLVITRYRHALEGMWVASILMLICGGIFALRFKETVRREAFFAILLGFFVFDVSLLDSKFIGAIPMKDNAYFSKDTANRYFERDKGFFRVLNYIQDSSMNSIPYRVPNKYILYKIHSATGYEAVGTARYSAILDSLSLEGNIVDLLNIKYIVMDKYGVPGAVGDTVGKFDIVVDEDVKVLRNSNVLPRVFPVHDVRVIEDKELVLAWLDNPSFNPRKTVLLEDNVALHVSSSRPETESTVEIVSYKDDEIRIDAGMADNGFVVLSEKYYPGWKAYLDGKPAKIYQADYILRAIYVPQGNHKLTVRYEPDSYWKGLYITLATFLIVAATILLQGVQLYRTRNK